MDGHTMGDLVADPMVDDYLRRLDLAAAVLPDQHRRELVDEIAGHIAESQAGGQAHGEAQMRTLLDRIGTPEEIVAAAREGDDPIRTGAALGPGRRLVPRRPTAEIVAVLLLTVGSLLLPVAGWAAGVVMVWMSRRWRTSEKLLATLVFPGGPGLAFILGAFGLGTGSCSTVSGSNGQITNCTGLSGVPWLAIAGFVTWVGAPIVVGIVLFSRARERAAAEAPIET